MRNVVEDPGDFRGREIGIQYQARSCMHDRFGTITPQPFANVGCPAVLPDDGGRDWLTGLPIPDHRGFTLIGDADGGQLTCQDFFLCQYLLSDGELSRPDFVGVMFHPAGLGEMLGEFALGHSTNLAQFIKDDRAATGGPFVECEYKWHGHFLRKMNEN